MKQLTKILKTFEKTKRQLDSLVASTTTKIDSNADLIVKVRGENTALSAERLRAQHVADNIDALINPQEV